MWRRAVLIAAAVLGLAHSWARAGETAATVGISARVDPFAEWCASETPAPVVTAGEGRSLRIEKTLRLFANTDVTLTLSPRVNRGILTASGGQTLATAAGLTGDVELADTRAHGGMGGVYRVRHVPGRGAYDVTLDVRATLAPAVTARSAKATSRTQGAGEGSKRVDTIVEVSASAPDAPDAPGPTTYRCGFSITASW